eukprot:7906872-Prorocentrum_lima.AAC.1
MLSSSIRSALPLPPPGVVGGNMLPQEPPLPALPQAALEDGECIPGPPVSLTSSTGYAPIALSAYMPPTTATKLSQKERKRRV